MILLMCIKISFAQTIVTYFIAPSATISANFRGTLDAGNCPTGYAKIEITAANAATFNAIAPQQIKRVFTQLQNGTALRNNLNNVFRNSNGTVTRIEYWLADDRTSLTGSTTTSTGTFVHYADASDANKIYVWPAAYNFSSGTNTFTGRIGLGEHQLHTDQVRRTGGINSIDEVVLHESSHTQFTGEWSKWGGVDGHAITYGADGMHYFSIAELIGDQEGALNEGLATFYGYIMNNAAYIELLNSYADAGRRYFVEARSVLAGQRELYSITDRVQDRLSGQTYANGDPVIIFTYTWRQVPGFFLLFAESTSTAFFSIFRNSTYANMDTTMSMIRNTAQSMSASRRKRFLTYACNRLALKMEEYNASAVGSADPSKISSIFPFALLDLLTHFGMPDTEYQADYVRNYADRNPRAYTEYFTRRNALRTLVQSDVNASPIRFSQALQSIINYCKQPANMF